MAHRHSHRYFNAQVLLHPLYCTVQSAPLKGPGDSPVVRLTCGKHAFRAP